MTKVEFEYKSLVEKVTIKIDKIVKLGINMDKFNDDLFNITVDLKNQINLSDLQSSNTNFDIYYQEAIRKLTNLDLNLDKYDVYFKAINTCRYLDVQIEKNTYIDSENINVVNVDYVESISNKIKRVLNSVKNFKSLPYEEEILKQIYKTTYNVIKFELISCGKSEVYDYVKHNKQAVGCLGKYVDEDIKKLDLEDIKYQTLMERMYELDSIGLDSNYFDLVIIKLLLNYDEKINLNNIININFDKLLNEIENSNSTLEKEVSAYKSVKEYYEKNIEELIKCKNQLIRRGTSLILSLTVTLGIAVGIFKVSKKHSYDEKYNTTITTYSDWNGLSNKEGFFDKDEADKYNRDSLTYLNIYGIWEKNNNSRNKNEYKRVIKTYNISNYNFDNIEEYLEYDVESYGVDFVESEEIGYGVTDLYREPYVEVKKIAIDKSEVIEKLNTIDLGFTLSCVYIFYFALLVAIIGSTNGKFIFEQYFDVIYYLKKYINDKNITKEELKELSNFSNQLLNMINNNDLLKAQFNKLYEENKYLLDNPEELYARLSELSKEFDVDNTKKLIKIKA